MKRKSLLAAAATVLLIAIAEPTPVNATTTTTWYSTASDLGISAASNVFSDALTNGLRPGPPAGTTPAGKTSCYLYGMGVKSPNVGGPPGTSAYTGVPDASPVGNGQRGISDTWPGSTACQIRYAAEGLAMGFQLHKDSIVQDNSVAAVGSLYGMGLVHNWGTNSANYGSNKPWAGYGPTARLQLETQYAIQSRGAGAAAEYGQIVVSLVDTTYTSTTESKSIWLTVKLWDSRSQYSELVHRDTGGTPNYIIDTVADSGRSFITLNPGSQDVWGTVPNAITYRVSMTRQNLINAVTVVNQLLATQGIAPHSTNPDDYAINQVSVATEMSSPQGTTGWIGSRVNTFKVSTETD